MGDRYVTPAGGLSPSQGSAARFDSADDAKRARRGARAVRLSTTSERDRSDAERLAKKGLVVIVPPRKKRAALPRSGQREAGPLRAHTFQIFRDRPSAEAIRAWITFLADDDANPRWFRYRNGAYDVQALYDGLGGVAFEAALFALSKAPRAGVVRFVFWVANPSGLTVDRAGSYKPGSARLLPRKPKDDDGPSPGELGEPVQLFSTYAPIKNAEVLLTEIEAKYAAAEEEGGEFLEPYRLGFQVFYGPLEREIRPRKRKKRGAK